MVRENLEIKSRLFGVRFERRGVNDPHVMLQLLTEDDGLWSEDGIAFSSHWLDDLIQVLTDARHIMGGNKNSPDGFGKVF